MLKLSRYEQQLIELLSGDLGDGSSPYEEIARKLGVCENQILESINKFYDNGLLRRLGATLRHQKSGFAANAMLVFEVGEADVEKAGEALAALSCVSHCYQRNTADDWPYNLYAMVHAASREELLKKANEMAECIKARQWKLLESLKELKKTSLKLVAA